MPDHSRRNKLELAHRAGDAEVAGGCHLWPGPCGWTKEPGWSSRQRQVDDSEENGMMFRNALTGRASMLQSPVLTPTTRPPKGGGSHGLDATGRRVGGGLGRRLPTGGEPGDGGPDRRGPGGDRGRRPACRRGRAAWQGPHARPARPRAGPHPRRGGRAHGGGAARALRAPGPGEWQAHPPDARGGRRGGPHLPRLRRGGQAPLRPGHAHGRRPRHGAALRRHHSSTAGRGGGHRSVQLPPGAVGPQGGGRPGGRERPHQQAAHPLPADAPRSGPLLGGGRTAPRRAPDAHRPRGDHRTVAGRERRGPAHHRDRQRRDRGGPGQGRGWAAQARAGRVGRKRRRHRLRRRGPGAGGRGHRPGAAGAGQRADSAAR